MLFDIELETECGYDYVEIEEGFETLGKYCGERVSVLHSVNYPFMMYEGMLYVYVCKCCKVCLPVICVIGLLVKKQSIKKGNLIWIGHIHDSFISHFDCKN